MSTNALIKYNIFLSSLRHVELDASGIYNLLKVFRILQRQRREGRIGGKYKTKCRS